MKCCKNCVYWDEFDSQDSNKQGYCRRYAPNLRQGEAEKGSWPVTFENDWCGDYAPNPDLNDPQNIH